MPPSQDPYGQRYDPRPGHGSGPGYRSGPGYQPPGYRPTMPSSPRSSRPEQYQPEPPRSEPRREPPRGAGPRVPSGARGRAVQIDPVLVEIVVGLAWLAVGTLGLDAAGAGTLVLAVAIGAGVWVGVENHRRGPQPLDPARSAELLRLGGGAVVAVIVASILFGLIGWSAFLPGLAAVVTGGALVMLSRATGQRPTRWLGVALVVLGVLSAFISTQAATGFVSQGLIGLVAGVLLLVSAADRVGLLEMLRDRYR